MPNLILFLASVLILVTVGILWLRHELLQELHEWQVAEQKLKKDCERERDRVPSILEGLREQSELRETWDRLCKNRSKLHGSCTLEEALNFHKEFQVFLKGVNSKQLNFLETKKELEIMDRCIEVGQKNVQMRQDFFESKRKQFPFSIASGIFGFQ